MCIGLHLLQADAAMETGPRLLKSRWKKDFPWVFQMFRSLLNKKGLEDRQL